MYILSMYLDLMHVFLFFSSYQLTTSNMQFYFEIINRNIRFQKYFGSAA